MEKKMTSGEIAKKAGVSQKAVRLYDEKGLLKPTDYSEGNYRLYDKEALDILEKIVALKTIGFSLEEIRDNLVAGDAVDIEDALRIQLREMENRTILMPPMPGYFQKPKSIGSSMKRKTSRAMVMTKEPRMDPVIEPLPPRIIISKNWFT